MIYTLTLNPSLDYIMHLDTLKTRYVNRSQYENLYPGGKGINVSIVLGNLGIPNQALGFIAAFTGDKINDSLKHLGCNTDFIKLDKGFSRINVKLQVNREKDTHSEETEINGMGPIITEEDLEKLYQKLDALQENDFLVLAGSIPSCVPNQIYQTIMKRLEFKKVHIVVDATKDLLMNVLQFKPFLIKPNQHELGDLFHMTLQSDEEIIYYVKKLQEKGARHVLISMGGSGSILVTEGGESFKRVVPKGQVINTVGSGDSMVAGFIAGFLKYHSLEEAHKFSTATGSATAFSPWLATQSMVDQLLLQL